MVRVALALSLLFSTLAVSQVSGMPAWTPVSLELANRNPFAIVIFLSLGGLLACHARHSWKVGWKFLSVTSAGLIPLLTVIAVIPPSARGHLTAFAVFLVLGIVWMLLYAEADAQRWITVGTLLLVSGCLAIGMILAFASVFSDVSDISPLGLFQKGFLLIFAMLAIRRPNLSPETA